MICPFCDHNDDKVIDSRASEGGRVDPPAPPVPQACSKSASPPTSASRTPPASPSSSGTAPASPFSRENILKRRPHRPAASARSPRRHQARPRRPGRGRAAPFSTTARSRAADHRRARRRTSFRQLDDIAYVRFASRVLPVPQRRRHPAPSSRSSTPASATSRTSSPCSSRARPAHAIQGSVIPVDPASGHSPAAPRRPCWSRIPLDTWADLLPRHRLSPLQTRFDSPLAEPEPASRTARSDPRGGSPNRLNPWTPLSRRPTRLRPPRASDVATDDHQ
jgi:hypothetical protein